MLARCVVLLLLQLVGQLVGSVCRAQTLYREGGYDSLLHVAQNNKQLSARFEADKQLASLAEKEGRNDRALFFLFRALSTAHRSKSLKDTASILLRIGLTYQEMNRYSEARDYVQRGLQTARRQGDSLRIGYAFAVQAELDQANGDLDSALRNYQLAADIYARAGSVRNQAVILHNLALTLKKFGQIDSSMIVLQQCIRIWEADSDTFNLAYAYRHLASAKLKQKGQLEEVRQLAQKSLAYSLQEKDTVGIADGYRMLASIDSARQDWPAAYGNLSRFLRYHERIDSAYKHIELLRMEEEYQAEQRILNLERTDKENKRLLDAGNRALLLAGIGLGLLLVLLFFLFRARRKEKKSRAQLEKLYGSLSNKNEEIESQNLEIRMAHQQLELSFQEVNQQRDTLQEQHRNIMDSFHYASRIQQAILPDRRSMEQHLPPHFVFYRPRDIVSGDFYWLTRTQGRSIFALVDCTGHGVPGAFMSVVGANLLNQIVEEHGIDKPHAILSALNRRINQLLHQTDPDDPGDGMDIGLIVIHDAQQGTHHKGKRIVEFAGAARPLWVLQDNKITEHKSGMFSCGGLDAQEKAFPSVELHLRKGDRLYLFTDGLTDQFGRNVLSNGRLRKLSKLRLEQWLLESAEQDIATQGQTLAGHFTRWQGTHRQLDDVLAVGIEL